MDAAHAYNRISDYLARRAEHKGLRDDSTIHRLDAGSDVEAILTTDDLRALLDSVSAATIRQARKLRNTPPTDDRRE